MIEHSNKMAIEMVPSVLPFRTHYHSAWLEKRHKPLAHARNALGGRTRGCGWSNLTLHAEIAVLKKVDLSQIAGTVLFVQRVGALGELRNSFPCPDCQRKLRAFRLKWGGPVKVIYSVHDGLDVWSVPR